MIYRLCLWALALYPRAWRERYEPELQALLEVRELSPRTITNLLRGAFDAHLHPAGLLASPRQRMRGTIAAALSCWVAVVMLGASFAKGTEDKPFRGVTPSHPAVTDARIVIAVLGVLSFAVVALAGAPLAYRVLREAWRERTPALMRAIRLAVLAVGVFAVATALLVLRAPGHPGSGSLGRALFVVYGCVVVLVAVACVLAARAGLMAARFRGIELVLGLGGAWLLARLLAAITLAVAVYAVLLAIDSPSAAASPNGPLSISTTVMLASQAAGMALASWAAAVTTRRGMLALRGA